MPLIPGVLTAGMLRIISRVDTERQTADLRSLRSALVSRHAAVSPTPISIEPDVMLTAMQRLSQQLANSKAPKPKARKITRKKPTRKVEVTEQAHRDALDLLARTGIRR